MKLNETEKYKIVVDMASGATRDALESDNVVITDEYSEIEVAGPEFTFTAKQVGIDNITVTAFGNTANPLTASVAIEVEDAPVAIRIVKEEYI